MALRLKTEQEAERATLRLKTEQILEAKDLLKDKFTIEQMDLSVRAYNCLKRKGINFLSDLMPLTAEDLMKLPSMGRKAVDEIIEKVEKLTGYRIKDYED